MKTSVNIAYKTAVDWRTWIFSHVALSHMVWDNRIREGLKSVQLTCVGPTDIGQIMADAELSTWETWSQIHTVKTPPTTCHTMNTNQFNNLK